MLIPTFQMRAPSKRWIVVAGVLVTSLVSIARSFGGAPALAGKTADGRRQTAVLRTDSINTDSARSPEASLIDSDNDGIPDTAELRSFQDRESFRRWFTSVAELQFYQLSAQWNVDQRDCSGLVRFAMREALRRHDRPWFQKMGPGYETVAPDVAGFDLDHNPLGEKIFRTDFGSFHESDLRNGRFSEFADGRALKNFNSAFVSRDRREAEAGDLLFYY